VHRLLSANHRFPCWLRERVNAHLEVRNVVREDSKLFEQNRFVGRKLVDYSNERRAHFWAYRNSGVRQERCKHFLKRLMFCHGCSSQERKQKPWLDVISCGLGIDHRF
jgi:hypothetical protein